MKRIAIIDYGVSNLDSVARALEVLGATAVVTDSSDVVLNCDAIILPGVGAFKRGMTRLNELGFVEVLRGQVSEKKVPLLGICLGMQLLASIGTEGGEIEGLGLIPGRVERFAPKEPRWRIPHIGWNEVNYTDSWPLFEGLESGRDFYFVHSYHFIPDDFSDIMAITPYCHDFVSAVRRDNVFGAQFHPEKSQKNGFVFLKNFIEY